MWSGLVDVIQRVRGRPRVAPRNWMTIAGRWSANQARCTRGGGHYGHIGNGSPGWHPFLPGSLSLHILHLIALQLSEWAEKALIQQKRCDACTRYHTQRDRYGSHKVLFQFRRVPQIGLWDTVKIRKISPAAKPLKPWVDLNQCLGIYSSREMILRQFLGKRLESWVE